MKQKIKVFSFVLGILLIFLIFQFQFFQRDTWRSWSLPLSGKVIYLDPGHGGPDGGAGDETALEKHIALSVTLKLRDYLQEQGALVLLTRDKDIDLASPGTKGYSRRKVEDLQKRLKMINSSNADLFLSIHLNSIPGPQWRGAQTFFSSYYPANKRLASFIQDELKRNLENTDRTAKLLQNVYILKNAKKPGALVEIGFLSNQDERQSLMNQRYQEKVAASISHGINEYFTNAKKSQK